MEVVYLRVDALHLDLSLLDLISGLVKILLVSFGSVLIGLHVFSLFSLSSGGGVGWGSFSSLFGLSDSWLRSWLRCGFNLFSWGSLCFLLRSWLSLKLDGGFLLWFSYWGLLSGKSDLLWLLSSLNKFFGGSS
jgi:hypothetical protein